LITNGKRHQCVAPFEDFLKHHFPCRSNRIFPLVSSTFIAAFSPISNANAFPNETKLCFFFQLSLHDRQKQSRSCKKRANCIYRILYLNSIVSKDRRNWTNEHKHCEKKW
jgi:hypothetical protein